MRTYIISICILVVVIGCGHVSGGWDGAPKEELLSVMGKPDEIVKVGAMSEAYVYKNEDCTTSFTLNWRNVVSKLRTVGECKGPARRAPAKAK